MMDLEAIEKRHQIFPETFLNGLAAVIAEADMHGTLAANAPEHVIDSRESPLTVLRVAANIGLIKLFAVSANQLELSPHYGYNCHSELGPLPIKPSGHH